MVATEDNCVFVNFHKTNKHPQYGISDFFNKIALFVERTDAYKRFQRNSSISEEEFQKKIKEEAKIRKIRAKALISRHKIGSAIAGIFPGGDYVVNKFFIKKDAARKAGQIFGFDLKELEESLKREEKKKEENKNIQDGNKMLLDEDRYEGPHLKVLDTKNKINNEKEEEEEEEESDEDKKNEDLKDDKKLKQKKLDKKIKAGAYGTMYTCSAVSYSTSLPRILFAASGVGLLAVSAVFSIIGSAIGMGVGYYLMKRHCEDLLDQFELLFIQNADRISDSLVYGVNYLKTMSEYYKKLGC